MVMATTCKWPSEVMQDDVQGWMLRVAPMRNPTAHYGDWEHYTADPGLEGAGGGGENFYFNRKTFEATYETPPELLQDSQQHDQSQLDYDQTYDQSYDQTYDQSYDQTYDPASSPLISNRNHDYTRDYSAMAFDESSLGDFVTGQYGGTSDQLARTNDSAYSYA